MARSRLGEAWNLSWRIDIRCLDDGHARTQARQRVRLPEGAGQGNVGCTRGSPLPTRAHRGALALPSVRLPTSRGDVWPAEQLRRRGGTLRGNGCLKTVRPRLPHTRVLGEAFNHSNHGLSVPSSPRRGCDSGLAACLRSAVCGSQGVLFGPGPAVETWGEAARSDTANGRPMKCEHQT
jgi:hypothetical protein